MWKTQCCLGLCCCKRQSLLLWKIASEGRTLWRTYWKKPHTPIQKESHYHSSAIQLSLILPLILLLPRSACQPRLRNLLSLLSSPVHTTASPHMQSVQHLCTSFTLTLPCEDLCAFYCPSTCMEFLLVVCLSVNSSVNRLTISIQAEYFVLQFGLHTTGYTLEEIKNTKFASFGGIWQKGPFFFVTGLK